MRCDVQQLRSWAYVVHKEYGWDSEDKVDNTDDTGGEERDGGSSQTNLREDSRGVVDDGVDTERSSYQPIAHGLFPPAGCSEAKVRNSPSPLLQSLSTGSEHQSVEKGLGRQETLVLPEGNLEVDIVVAVSLLGSFTLDQSLGLESSELELNLGVLGGSVSELGESNQTFLLSTYKWVSSSVKYLALG